VIDHGGASVGVVVARPGEEVAEAVLKRTEAGMYAVMQRDAKAGRIAVSMHKNAWSKKIPALIGTKNGVRQKAGVERWRTT
jgi:hypothetical protein